MQTHFDNSRIEDRVARVPAALWCPGAIAMAASLTLLAPAGAGVLATYTLGPVSVSGNVVSHPLSLTYTASSGERVAYFAVDVSGSAGALTANGTDYSAFSFTLAPGLAANWDQIPFTDFGPGPFGDTTEFETLSSYLAPGTQVLGVLSIDFGLLGLPVSTSHKVSVVGPDSVVGSEIPGQPGTFGFDPVGEGADIPEPQAWAGLAGLGCLLATLLRRRLEH
jgi:hypothetical protein